MTLFILNLRISVISMALQKLEPRAIYLHGPDSSDLKALLKKNHFCKLRFFWMDCFLLLRVKLFCPRFSNEQGIQREKKGHPPCPLPTHTYNDPISEPL